MAQAPGERYDAARVRVQHGLLEGSGSIPAGPQALEEGSAALVLAAVVERDGEGQRVPKSRALAADCR